MPIIGTDREILALPEDAPIPDCATVECSSKWQAAESGVVMGGLRRADGIRVSLARTIMDVASAEITTLHIYELSRRAATGHAAAYNDKCE